jgi:WD40 repeat protein
MELVSDAQKFIATHASTIAHAPLQTYVSALLFTPAPNVIRELFAAEAPGWVTLSQPEVTDDNHSGPVRAVVFSPTDGNSKFVASASGDNTLKIWDAQSRKCTQTLRGHTDMIWSPTFSHDSSMLCSASEDGTVRIWDVDAVGGTDAAKAILDGQGDASFSRRLTLTGHIRIVWKLAFAHAGELIATCSGDRSVKIWDTVTGMCLQTFEGHTATVYSVAFHRNNLLASVSHDKTLRLWDVKAKTCTRIISLSNDRFLSRKIETEVIFSPDGHRVVTSGPQIRVWEVATGLLLLTVATETSSTAYSRDGKWLASGSSSDDDAKVRLWDMGTGSCDREFKPPIITSPIMTVALSHGSEMLVAAGYVDGGLTVWHAGSGVCLFRRSRDDTLCVFGLAFTRGNSQLVSGFEDGIVQVSSAATGICLQEFKGHNYGDINSISISHDGRYLATAGDDSTAKIWDIAYSRAIWAATFSHDNKMLATCCEGGTVRTWELATGESKVVLGGGADPVYAVAFDHGRRHIATASGSGCVQIVPLSVDQTPHTLHGHDGAVWAVAYASDDRRLASAASDRTARVWDVLDGVCVQVLDIGVSLASIAFGVGNQYLRTEIGRIKLDTTAATDAGKPGGADPLEWQHDYALSADKCWVSDKGENVLWLPRDYRPLSVAIDDDNNRICIGCRSGRIYFFYFSADG